MRALDYSQSREIRVPVRVAQNMNKITKTERQMQQALGRDVAAEEIAKELHMTTDEVERMQSYIKNPVSLETPVGEEEDGSLEEFIEDTQGRPRKMQLPHWCKKKKCRNYLRH